MKTANSFLIMGGRVIDPVSGFDAPVDVAVAAGKVLAIKQCPSDFQPERVIDASGCIVIPGLVDLAVHLCEPGREHEGMLRSEMAAAVAGGITSLVCPPDTDPVLDEPGLVEMLCFRAAGLNQARVYPLGALTQQLRGEALSEMLALAEAGCVGFSQAQRPLADTQVLLRAFQYAATFGYTLWLRPQDYFLGQGVAASGALCTRLGLAGVPVAAETIALHTIFELMRASGARVHLCRLSSAAGVALVRQAKLEGLELSCDVSINSLLLTDADIGYFDSRARLDPPLRQQTDRAALQAALADGTIDALVSDHTPVDEDAKTLPFAQSEAGASGVELLLGLAVKWSRDNTVSLQRALQVVTSSPASVLAAAVGQPDMGALRVGAVADLCIFDPGADWTVTAAALRSQGKHTPFSGYELPARVRYTMVAGRLAYQA